MHAYMHHISSKMLPVVRLQSRARIPIRVTYISHHKHPEPSSMKW